jgi:hypothetical protein
MKTRVSTLSNLFLMLSFFLLLQSCNKEDFYQKEYLDNPYQAEPTDPESQGGANSGTDQGAQGGANGSGDTAVTGGQTGSNTAGTDGSTAGGSTGGTTTGGVEGATTSGQTTAGSADGSATGGTTGSTTGDTTGSAAGGTTGPTTGGANYGDCNNGHGNDWDRIDESNPNVGLESKCKREIFRQVSKTAKKLDVVWIIDNSGSMADEQASLGANFSAFIDNFITKDVDFRMAVTTTDVSSADRKGRLVQGSDTKLTAARAQADEARFKEDFTTLVRVGTRGSGNEKGLEASEGFMQKYAKTFLRDDAYLAIVVVSDEEDQSAQSVKHYTEYIKSFKAHAGLVKIYTIADVNRTNFGNGIATGADRYVEASTQTAGVVADIRNDFHRSLGEMGESIINLLDSFALANDPVPGTLRVFVNGAETTRYSFDETSRSIRFDAGNLPPVGAEVRVQYVKQ